MDSDQSVSLRVEFAPDDGSLLLPGSVTITRTTLSVFKLRDSADEEPLFIGVSSVPLIKFSRQPSTIFPSSDALLLTSVSGHLFVNAALTAGMGPSKEGSAGSTASTSTGIVGSLMTDSSTRRLAENPCHILDNPALWMGLRLEFPVMEACDRCVEALLARHAVEMGNSRTSTQSSNRSNSLPRSERTDSKTSGSKSGHYVATAGTATGVPSDRMHTCRSPAVPYEGSYGSSEPYASITSSKNGIRRSPNPAPQSRGGEYPSEISEAQGGSPGDRGQSQLPRQRSGSATLSNTRGEERRVSSQNGSRDGGSTPRGLPQRSRRSDGSKERSAMSELRSRHNSIPSQRSDDGDIARQSVRSSHDSASTPRSQSRRSQRSDDSTEGRGPNVIRHHHEPLLSQRSDDVESLKRSAHSPRRGGGESTPRALPRRSQRNDSCRTDEELVPSSGMRTPYSTRNENRELHVSVHSENLVNVVKGDSCMGNSKNEPHSPRSALDQSQMYRSCVEAIATSEMGTPRSAESGSTSSVMSARERVSFAERRFNESVKRDESPRAVSSSVREEDALAGSGIGHDRAFTPPPGLAERSQAVLQSSQFPGSAERSGAIQVARLRSEQQCFVRSVLRFVHHRLHLLQYLHREVVNEAYLVEEARLLGKVRTRSNRRNSPATSVSFTASRLSNSPRRQGHASLPSESGRLREIEERLREVENLHRAVEQERSELEQQRREVQQLRQEAEDKLREAALMTARFSAASREMELSFHNRPGSQSIPLPGTSETRLSQNNAKLRDAEISSGSVGDLKAFVAQQQLMDKIQGTETCLDEADYPVAYLDRYIYGDEWCMLYPAREADIRFSVLIDTCLVLKLPRRLVTITNVTVDQPGLRITAEIRHDPETMPRDLLCRRFNSQPFRLLQSLYELRHFFANEPQSANNASQSLRRASRGTSRATTPRGNYRHSAAPGRSTTNAYMFDEDALSDVELVGENVSDPVARMYELQRAQEEKARQREIEMGAAHERKQMALQQQRLMEQLEKLQQDESTWRSRITLNEAQMRQAASTSAAYTPRVASCRNAHELEEKEQVDRAVLEVGYARQMQALMRAHRRSMAYLRLLMQEADRRARHIELEEAVRTELDLMLNPQRWRKAASMPEVNERARRQKLIAAEAKQRNNIYTNLRTFLVDALQNEMEALVNDEMTARMVTTADEVKKRIDLYCWSQSSGALTPRTGRSTGTIQNAMSPQALQALLAEESMERVHLGNEERRRLHLFQREYVLTTEDVMRNEIELRELDDHVLMLDILVQRNRALLERRRQDQESAIKLLNEEQFYRKGIISDERDELEVMVERFDAELNLLFVEETGRLSPLHDLECANRRRCMMNSPRQTKMFHYMTFLPEDMDHPPTANLAIEGMLGCSINKNLEVTCIARPLPKAEGEDLQFQAGDMILDVAGYSLHSLSHLREVLANRAMQIQHEALEEFDDVPEDELTTNPALQKYVEVLCEHHNFLVQVLRGCDIFQIIVKS
ncbi:hypothetical protein ERJ75_001764900 [Trypanosoma vivax]|nr:hypothetical protein ERJ75_001764900 [Trypanosoma vivax]